HAFVCLASNGLSPKSWSGIPNASARIPRWREKGSRISFRSYLWTTPSNRSAVPTSPNSSRTLNSSLFSVTMPQFKSHVVLVTGGGSGIGLSAATKFAGDGAHVIITGRSQAALMQSARTVPGLDYVVADVGKPSDAARTIEEV